MSLETLSFGLGGILILIGIIGGGIEIKEIKIPQVGKLVRMTAIISGLLFVSLGIGMKEAIDSSEKTYLKSSTDTSLSTVNFKIQDNLGVGQVREYVRISIDGRNIGNIIVNEYQPTSEISVRLPQKDSYRYVLEGSASYLNDNGEFTEVNITGKGEITIESGEILQLSGDLNGDTLVTELVKESEQ